MVFRRQVENIFGGRVIEVFWYQIVWYIFLEKGFKCLCVGDWEVRQYCYFKLSGKEFKFIGIVGVVDFLVINQIVV